MSNFNWLSRKMFSRRMVINLTRVNRRYLSNQHNSTTQREFINWNHPRMKTLRTELNDYSELDLGDRATVRAFFGGVAGGIIGGIVGHQDDCSNLSPTEETLLGALKGSFIGAVMTCFYPITIPLGGIIGVKKVMRNRK